MVIQRTIENLRDRPKHERRAVALVGAVGVMLVLFLGWMFFFFRTMHRNSAVIQPQDQAAGAANSVSGQ